MCEDKLSIINFNGYLMGIFLNEDKIGKYAWKDSGVNRNHHFLLPRNIRAIVCGKSGVGKTCLVTYLLLEPDALDYNNLIICGKSLHQPEYKIMKVTFSRGWSKSQVNKLRYTK